jgi:hypothetical protein
MKLKIFKKVMFGLSNGWFLFFSYNSKLILNKKLRVAILAGPEKVSVPVEVEPT